MDPYRDIIPHEQGETIRSLVRKRDESTSPVASSKRPRTRDGEPEPAGLDEKHDLNEPPIPEKSLADYDKNRLTEGLSKMKQIAKRDITPRTQAFVKMHIEAYRNALDEESPTKAAVAVVQALDQVYNSSAFYLKPRLPDEQERLMNYLKLRRLELLGNYGDYLGQNLQEIRARLNKEAAARMDPDLERASAALGRPYTWVQIAENLQGVNAAEMHKNVGVACAVLGLDPNHMIWLINEWAARNDVFHNQVREYINTCDWSEVAKAISRDLKELIKVCPDQETARSYEKVLLSIREEYFDVIDDDEPRSWVPNEKALSLLKSYYKKQNKKRP